MLGSPVEVRYDDGDSVVLIQADTGGPARSSTGSSGTATQATSQSSGEGGIARAGQDSESGGVGGGPGSGESRRIIIHDRHRAAGGSITILTPNNNLKISINKKRRYPGRPHEFQNAKRVLTHDLRHKLGELDELLKACDSENDDEDVDHRDDGVVGAADANGNGKVSPKTVTPPPRKDACAMPAKQRHTSPVEERPANGMVEQTNQVSTTAGDTGLGGRARKVEEAEYQLKPGEDVLVRIAHNDQYYLGTVIELEPKQSCLVRFEDQTTLRVELSRITRMTTNGIRTVKDHSSQLHTTCRPDEHEEQEEDEEEQDEEEVEFVPTTNGHSESTSPPQTPPPAPPSRSIVIPDGFSPLTSTTQLPYNPHALHWDKYHRVNTEGHYCYCGADGEWSREMIQCQRCEQWFHGRCVRSLQFPIFLGDTSYLFICSICNHGHEFVRRFELPVLNLVHLALYNLIMRNGCRLYDLRLAIIPYIEDNQRTLQLPDSFLKLSTNERIELVQVVLRNNGDRFLNGKEMSLSVHLWTLRKALPPTTESISIPIAPEETVTEHLLRKLPECLQVCRFLPRTNHEKNYFMDAVSRERMLGLSYAERPISVEDPRINFAELIVSPACFNAFNCAATNNTTSATTANAPQPLSNQTADATVPSTAVTSLSTTPDQFTTINGARLVGAQKRKQRGIRYINPPILLPMSDGLEMIFPLLANFDGPNNPFYGVEQSVVTFGRARGRKGPMKRRLFEGQRQGLPIKRQLAGDSMHKRGTAAASQLSRGSTSQLAKIDENAVLSELSVRNVQRHNSAHSTTTTTTTAFRRRSSRTYSTSSTGSEQAGAPGAGSDRSGAASDTSSMEEKPLASGRRSSGRLVALGSKDYSDTKRRKRRRNSDTAVAVSGNAENQEQGQPPVRGGSGGYMSSASNSSCQVSGVFWDPDAVSGAVPNRKKTRPMFAVVGKRVLPDGQQELLLEEQ